MEMSQYRELFFSETAEYLKNFSQTVLSMETAPDDREKLDSLFRYAHSIKGMAAAMGYDAIAGLAHKVEDLMERIRKSSIVFDSPLADLLLKAADHLEGLVADEAAGMAGKRDISDFVLLLARFGQQNKTSVPPEKPEPVLSEFSQVLERQTIQTVKVHTEVLDNLINITGELVTNKHRLLSLMEQPEAPVALAMQELSRLLKALHNEVLDVRMTPFSAITDRFPRMVRDMGRKTGKEILFTISGADIGLDRGILEELSDPLVHILRNSVDHGIEPEEERIAEGKEGRGRILLSVEKKKDHVLVIISDDGRGMDSERIAAAAVEKGILTAEAATGLSRTAALMLICRPGFSTARTVTDVSGRGVGMDIVQSTLQRLGGALQIDSRAGEGTTMTLRLPLSTAIVDSLLVSCAGFTLAFPVSTISRTMDISRSEIAVKGRHKVFHLNDEVIPLLSMGRILGNPAPYPWKRSLPVVVAEAKGRKVGLAVDRILGFQEVFVKPVGPPLEKMKALIGGTIVGNGEVVLVFDAFNMI